MATDDRRFRLLSVWLLATAPVILHGEPQWDCQAQTASWSCQGGDDNPVHPADEGAILRTASPQPAAPAPAATNQPAQSPQPKQLSRLDEGLAWDYCGFRPARLGALKTEPLPSPDTPIEINADAFDFDQNTEIVTFSGNIEAERGNQRLLAEHVRYDRPHEQLHAEGDALFIQPELRVLGTSGDFNLADRSGQLFNVHYRLVGTNARGSAAEARLVDAARSRYRDITFTTCPPGDRTWDLQADELEIDRDTGTGVTRHTKLRLGGVPVLYSPYLDFPIDGRRKSGFLVPSIGNGSKTGFTLTVPYYFNLAPNLDLTLSPRLMTERGLMLRGDFRYLTEGHRGQLDAELLPRDAKDEDKTRGAVHFTDSGILAPGWSTDLNINYVSDDTYLEDFGNSLQLSSVRNLERRGDLVYQNQDFYFRGRLLDFQTVESDVPEVDRPYSRLPQLLVQYDRPQIWSSLDIGIGGEYDNFYHASLVHGQRFSVRPYLSWPLRESYGHLKPTLILNHSSYALVNEAAGKPSSPAHTIPTASLDAALVFERPWNVFGAHLIQTLEPRLFYLYTPYRDQRDTPVFDSAELDPSFANLFRENRFTGRDRIGDANQITLGLSSRGLSSATGAELYRLSIGQIRYFRDRLVQIVGPPEDSSTSPVVAEVGARLSEHWSGRAGLAWEPDGNDAQTLKKSLQIRYQSPDNLLFNAAYRYNQDTEPSTPQTDTSYKDADLSFRWPVNPQLELVGRWYHSLLYDQIMDAFVGVEYGRCCWRVRAIAGQHRSNAGQDLNKSLMLQFELTGLGQFGQRVDRFLERGIDGYRAENRYVDR